MTEQDLEWIRKVVREEIRLETAALVACMQEVDASLRKVLLSLAERVVAQSDLLSKRAEKPLPETTLEREARTNY